MVSNRLNGVLRHLLRNVRPLEGQDSDASLLELYVRHRNESAFESLLARHGPLVLGVCRRVLANEQDAEDAFQATFLILIRKAASVKRQASLGSWLYRVAYRTAQEARRAVAKRRTREARVARPEEAPAPDDDLREVLDKELSTLPARYRAAVVLCDLEGKERKEAARELGCPEGTVASRLARGRLLLAKRLAGHGLTASTLAALKQQASATVCAELISSTVRAALSSASAGAAGAVSANVSSLVERVVRSMLMVKLRAMTALVLFVGVVGSGAGWLYYHREVAAQPNAPKDAVARPEEGAGAEQEKLRQELKLLQADLRRANERAAALEARLKKMEQEPEEVLFRGKPATHWYKLLKDRDPDYRTEAVKALGALAKVDRTVLPVLAGALNDDDDNVVRQAATALAYTSKAAVPFLAKALKEPRQRNKAAVFTAIGQLGREAEGAVAALIEILRGDSRDDRRRAAATLGEIEKGAKAAVPALIELLRGKDQGDQYAAAIALGKIGPAAKAAVPDLIGMLKGPGRGPRQAAAWALGRIGPDAKPAIPALLEAQRESYREKRTGTTDYLSVLEEAIDKIDPKAGKSKRP